MSAPTGDTLSSAQQTLALRKIQELEQKTKKTKTSEYVNDVKYSILFRPGYNWDELLSAAPVSVSLLASLFVASTIPDATQITIIPPSDGFKHLMNFDERPSLNACLIQCADGGAKAFGTAATSFDAIALKSSTIKHTINQIIEILSDSASAKSLLGPTVKNLARVAKKCEEHAKGMETAFETWLKMVCEVHTCVVQTSSSASEKRAANQIHLAAAQAKVTSAEETKKLASESVSILKNTLKTATKAYEKAADEFPSGWDLVAQQFVSDLSESFTTAINLAIPALIENYSMSSKIEHGLNIFKGDNGGAQGGSVGDGKADHSKVQNATQAPPTTPSAVPPFPNDPAFGVIGPIRGYVTTIQSFLTGGPDNGVDWDLLQSTDPAKRNNGLGVITSLIEDAQKNFKPSNDPPSQTLISIFSEVLNVTSTLQKAIDNNKAINSTPLPNGDSAEVKDWQLQVNKAVTKAVGLDTNSKLLVNGKSIPSINPTQPTSAPTDKKGAFRQQIIDAATTKLNTTAKVMETVTDNYQKASDKLLEVQLKIGEIQGELADLQASNINLDKIKAILVKCIDILVQLKSQINRLVSFFSAVSTLVDHVVQDQVEPFITYLNATTGSDEPERTILNFSFTDLQRQLIFGFSLNIRAYFDLFRDIAEMYIEVHNKHMRPGLELVNSMQTEYNNISDPNEAQKTLHNRSKKVSDFTTEATAGVKELVLNRQKEIATNLSSNAQAAAADLDFIPASPAPEITKAITASAETSKEAAQKGINQSGKYLTRKFSDTSSLIDDDDD